MLRLHGCLKEDLARSLPGSDRDKGRHSSHRKQAAALAGALHQAAQVCRLRCALPLQLSPRVIADVFPLCAGSVAETVEVSQCRLACVCSTAVRRRRESAGALSWRHAVAVAVAWG